ncbi:helix-turn-helix transcriptional regulator [Aliikangiella marina]|uniref:Helix-turn-helix transcriptional regulator n=1 Tax=Aliikangiella marina TaxID=1712262 RepID=A0A545T922_9GAMM|nr:helix-turn-helix transcriptional regulator [Aliikangiella marina]TQV73723.1 helix-turn-helix transcriptional regulator [Aliikangiella marina]
MHFGEKLRQLRKDKEWTQPQLAEAIGIEQSYLSKLENGKSAPSADIFQMILDAFQVDTASLLEDVDSSVVHRQLRQVPEVANYLNQQQLASSRKNRRWLISSALMTTFGIVLVSSSFMGLIFPELQYNYQSKGIVLAGESKEIFSNYRHQMPMSREEQVKIDREMTQRLDEVYRITDIYRGDIFNVPVEGGSRTFRLVDTRHEDRIENRFLSVFGILLTLLGLFGFVLEKKLFPRR